MHSTYMYDVYTCIHVHKHTIQVNNNLEREYKKQKRQDWDHKIA